MKFTLRKLSQVFLVLAVFFVFLSVSSGDADAASATEIEVKSDATMKLFNDQVNGGARFLNKASGYLVFPSVFKAGFLVGGEYGEGALRVNGKTVDYYSTASASFGLQAGAQSKSIVIVFLSQKALQDFRNSKGWKVGVDGSVALVEWGGGENVNSVNIKDPIVGFVFSNKGLMFNLSLEGSKLTKLKNKK